MAMEPALKRREPSGLVWLARAAGRSEYSMTWGTPLPRMKLPTFSVAEALEVILLDISLPVISCRPMKRGSMQWTRGLSTWK